MAGLALLIAAGMLAWDSGPVYAQAGARNNPRRTGFPQQKKGRQQPANELTPDQQPESGQTGGGQLQPSPEDRLIPNGIGPKQRMALLRVFNQLNLTGDQRTKLMQLRRETGNRLGVLNRLRQVQNEALEEALYGSEFDPKVVEQKAADLAATTTEIIKLQSRILSQIRQIMTPEQALKFRELLDEFRRPAAGPPARP